MSLFPLAVARRYALPVAFLAGLGTAYAVSRSEPQLSASTATPVNAIVAPATASYADAVDKAAPAVVQVTVDKHEAAQMQMPEDFLQRFFGPDRQQMQPQQRQGRSPQRRLQPQQGPLEEGLGSGVIMTADGTILTNNHVVEGAEHVSVSLKDGREYTAKVLGTDPASDLAVIKISASNLPTLPVADSDKIRVGDVVLAIGNPLNVGQTVTMGIISAKGRSTSGDNSTYEDFLQTDAPINRGNSGGALITTSGELVGINSQILSPSGGSIGIGFAIPSNMAENVMSQLISTGHVRRGLLGVSAQPLTSDLAKSLGLSSVRGAIVADVTPESPAAKAGLQEGDVILKVNGQPIDDSNELRNRISSLSPGTHVTLAIQHDGQQKDVPVTLSETTPASADSPSAPSHSNESTLGMTLQALTPQIAAQLQVPVGTSGVAVTDIDDSSAAFRAGIRVGDVIRSVDNQAVTSPSAVRDALARHADRPALLVVQHQDQRRFIAVPRG